MDEVLNDMLRSLIGSIKGVKDLLVSLTKFIFAMFTELSGFIPSYVLAAISIFASFLFILIIYKVFKLFVGVVLQMAAMIAAKLGAGGA